MKVDMFIDLVFANLFNKQAQEAMLTEMKGFDVLATEKFGTKFVNLSVKDRNEFLKNKNLVLPNTMVRYGAQRLVFRNRLGFIGLLNLWLFGAILPPKKSGKIY